MMIVIRNGRVIDPSQEIDGICDVMIEDGKIKEVRKSKGAAVRNKKMNSQDQKVIGPGCITRAFLLARESLSAVSPQFLKYSTVVGKNPLP